MRKGKMEGGKNGKGVPTAPSEQFGRRPLGVIYPGVVDTGRPDLSEDVFGFDELGDSFYECPVFFSREKAFRPP
jgi:hypothetical protein